MAIQLVGIVIILAQAVGQSRSTLLEERKLATRNVVEVAWSVLHHHAQLVAAGKLTLAPAQAQAAAAVAAQRYAGKEYFWINDMTPVMVMHPFATDLNGKDLTDFKDPDGMRLFIAMRDVVTSSKRAVWCGGTGPAARPGAVQDLRAS